MVTDQQIKKKYSKYIVTHWLICITLQHKIKLTSTSTRGPVSATFISFLVVLPSKGKRPWRFGVQLKKRIS
jgi:hypothetical protein